MNVEDAIRQRYSVRTYTDQAVEPDSIQAVLEAARLAPSASNRQEWRLVVVTDPAKRQELAAAANGQAFVATAPVVIACCAEGHGHVMACGHPCFLIDVAIAIDHMTLRAVELGLGTCWIGAFSQEKVRTVLGIPAGIEVVELLTIGYPGGPARAKQRLALEEIVKYEEWAS